MDIAKTAAASLARIRTFTPEEIAEWRAGWRIVLGAGIGMGTGVALYLMVASIFIKRVTAEFGWTRGDMGVAGMVAFFVGAIALPLIGQLLDRFGFRRIVLVSVPAMALLYLMLAANPGSYVFYIGLMVWGGLFGGGTSGLAYTRPVVAAFQRGRGLALGLATAGTSITGMIVPPILAIVIEAYGWRAGLVALAAIMLVVGLPLALALIGRAREGHAAAADDVPDAAHVDARDMTLREALRHMRLWLLVIALVAVNIPGSGVMGQLAPIVTDKGLSETAAAIVISVYATGILIGRLITGFSLDRLPAHLVGGVMTLIPAIGIMLLMIPSPSFALAATALLFMGLQQGSEVDLIAYFVSRGFGLKNYSSIYGVVAMAGALSTMVALVFFGKVHDWTKSYDIALIVGAVAFCIGAAAFAAIGRTSVGTQSG